MTEHDYSHPETLPDGAKATIWVMGAMKELEELGVVGMDCQEVTVAGLAVYDQLDASGWRPNELQIAYVLAAIAPRTDADDARTIRWLLANYRYPEFRRQLEVKIADEPAPKKRTSWVRRLFGLGE